MMTSSIKSLIKMILIFLILIICNFFFYIFYSMFGPNLYVRYHSIEFEKKLEIKYDNYILNQFYYNCEKFSKEDLIINKTTNYF